MVYKGCGGGGVQGFCLFFPYLAEYVFLMGWNHQVVGIVLPSYVGII